MTVLTVKQRSGHKRSELTKMRESGSFPAIVYGRDKPSEMVYVEGISFTKAMRESGRNGILELKVENGADHKVMLQDLQTDALKGDVVHADFYIVDMNVNVDVEVAIHLNGEAVGVKDGGILQQPLHQVSVRAKPNDIPERIEVDITQMKIGDSLKIADLTAAKHYHITTEEHAVVASILPPIADEPNEAEAEEEPTQEEASEDK